MANEPSPLPTAATQLRAARARIDELTSTAAEAVRRLESRPPSPKDLLALDQAFVEARRLLLTDPRLARLGAGLTQDQKAQLKRYSRRRYTALERRVAAAGARHRLKATNDAKRGRSETRLPAAQRATAPNVFNQETLGSADDAAP